MTSESRFLTAGVLSSTSGQVDIDLKTGSIVIKGPTGSIVIGSLESGDVQARIEGDEEIEPLKLSGVTLYGDLAAKVREVQAILAAHGAGELKLVKPRPEDGRDYLVVDGQMFINGASAQLIDSRKFAVSSMIKTATTESGFKVMAGLLSESSLCEQLVKNIDALASGPSVADQIRQVIRDELKPGGMLHRG